jgi:hypothetical protein
MSGSTAGAEAPSASTAGTLSKGVLAGVTRLEAAFAVTG